MFRVTITGNVGQDPDFKYSANGSAYMKFTVAVNTSKRNGDTWEQKTDWVTVMVFGRQAENFANSGRIAKGSRVLVDGRCELSAYISKKDEQPVASMTISANEVEVLTPAAGQAQTPTRTSPRPQPNGDLEDLPF